MPGHHVKELNRELLRLEKRRKLNIYSQHGKFLLIESSKLPNLILFLLGALHVYLTALSKFMEQILAFGFDW